MTSGYHILITFLLPSTKFSALVRREDFTVNNHGRKAHGSCCMCVTFSGICAEHTCQYYAVCLPKLDSTYECVCRTCEGTVYEPICASNGKTYANDCYMMEEACHAKRNTNILKRATCGKTRQFFWFHTLLIQLQNVMPLLSQKLIQFLKAVLFSIFYRSIHYWYRSTSKCSSLSKYLYHFFWKKHTLLVLLCKMYWQ